MPRHLSRMAIDKVSLVDNGANGRRIAITKREPMVSDGTEAVPEGVVEKVLVALGVRKSEDVTKETFDELQAEVAMGEAVTEGFDTLRAAVGMATYARHEDGTEYTMAEKRELVGTSIDQFRSYLLDAMGDEDVEKAGRKISGKRLDQIKAAFTVLGEVITGVEEGYWSPPDGTVAKETDMTPEEVQQMVDKAVDSKFEALTAEDGPLAKSISAAVADGITKAAPAPAPEPVEKPVEKAEADPDEITIETVAEAVTELAKQVNGSSRQSAAGDDGNVQKQDAETSVFAGIL